MTTIDGRASTSPTGSRLNPLLDGCNLVIRVWQFGRPGGGGPSPARGLPTGQPNHQIGKAPHVFPRTIQGPTQAQVTPILTCGSPPSTSSARTRRRRAVLVGLAREDADARVRRAAAARIETSGCSPRSRWRIPTNRCATKSRNGWRRSRPETAEDVARQALGALRDQKHIATVAQHLAARRDSPRGDRPRLRREGPELDRAAGRPTRASRRSPPSGFRTVPSSSTSQPRQSTKKQASARSSALWRSAIDREVLDGLATRAKNKSVNRRARTMVQALEEAETARREALERAPAGADLDAHENRSARRRRRRGHRANSWARSKPNGAR